MSFEVVLEVDGALKDPKTFVLPEMSLSSSRIGMNKHEFSLHIKASTIANRMASEYDAWVAESKLDDEIFGSPQDRLAEEKYPKLETLLTNSELVELVFGGYLIQELFRPLTWDRSCEIKYWFDVITLCTVNGDNIEIKGICYSKPQT